MMLTFLKIRDFLIIENAEIEFRQGLTVFTGETGTGKTILVNAIKILTGDIKGNHKKLLSGEQAEIEGVFYIEKDDELKKRLKEHELDDEQLILRRVVSKSGRDRYMINDRSVSSTMYMKIAADIIDIHSQNENQTLLKGAMQHALYDSYLGLERDLDKYKKLFQKYNSIIEEIANIKKEKEGIQKQYDFYSFQLNDINSVDPKPAEDIVLKERLSILKGYEEFKSTKINLDELLYENESSVFVVLDRVLKLFNQLSKYKDVKEKTDRINDIKEAVFDIYRDLNDSMPDIEDIDKIDELQNRLSYIERLYKYGKTVEEMIAYRDELADKISCFESSDIDLKRKTEELKQTKAELMDIALSLHEKRVNGRDKFQDHVNKELEKVAMKGALFRVEIESSDIGSSEIDLFHNGIDRVRFLINTTGKGFYPLEAIASGGELSRLMLVLKEIFLHADKVETMIFDEIDTGIGGETALSIGEKIKRISSKRQVIAITHLHQIAKYANQHFRFDRKDGANGVITSIKELDRKGRIDEIARMLGGEKISKNTLKLAEDLINENNNR